MRWLEGDIQARLRAGVSTERQVEAAHALRQEAELHLASDEGAQAELGAALVESAAPVLEYLKRAAFIGAVDIETFALWSEILSAGEAHTISSISF